MFSLVTPNRIIQAKLSSLTHDNLAFFIKSLFFSLLSASLLTATVNLPIKYYGLPKFVDSTHSYLNDSSSISTILPESTQDPVHFSIQYAF